MKPNVETMPWTELRAYVLAHRDDSEAFHTFIRRCKPRPNSTGYDFPHTEEGRQQMEEIFRQKLNGEL